MRRLVRHVVAGVTLGAVAVTAGAVAASAGRDDTTQAVPAVTSLAPAVPDDVAAPSPTPTVPSTATDDARAQRIAGQRSRSLTTQRKTISAAADKLAAQRKAEAKRKREAAETEKAADEAARKLEAKQKKAAENPTGTPREIARQIVGAKYDDGARQFGCFDKIIMRESKYDINARNPSSGAYGIPQALPGSKMASAGSDWRTNPATQIKWALGYMDSRYGSPCSAWGFKSSHGWY